MPRKRDKGKVRKARKEQQKKDAQKKEAQEKQKEKDAEEKETEKKKDVLSRKDIGRKGCWRVDETNQLHKVGRDMSSLIRGGNSITLSILKGECCHGCPPATGKCIYFMQDLHVCLCKNG